MSAIGKKIDKWDSELFKGPLGVVQVGFKGYDLGLTTAQTQFSPDMNVKEILYQQLGTKAADHVITGVDFMLECTFGEISTELLRILIDYLIATGGASGAGNDSGTVKADLYESMLETVAGVLRVISVNPSGVPSEDIEDRMEFYQAIPIINGAMVQWEADTQRNLSIQFMIKRKILTDLESSTHDSVFGYWGDPTQEDLPAAVWPDLAAPFVTAAAAPSATSVVLTFNETVTTVGGVTLTERLYVVVDNKVIIPTAAVPSGADVTLTLPAASISAGQTVTYGLTAGSLEDGDSNQNEVSAGAVVNNVP